MSNQLTENLNYNNQITAKFIGRSVNPSNNILSNLFYLRECIISTTGGSYLLYICENGYINKLLWYYLIRIDFILHYINYILLIILCFSKIKSINKKNYYIWIGLFGPVLLHCIIILYSICTIGIKLSSALKYALLFYAQGTDDIGGKNNNFIEFSSHSQLTYKATDQQTFYFGLMAHSSSTLNIMLYGDLWKKQHINYTAFLHNFGHTMVAIEIILGAVAGYDTTPNYLITYIVFLILSWCMTVDCGNSIWGCIGSIGECLLHIIFCPLICCCRCCCVLSEKDIKARIEQSVTIEKALNIDYVNFSCCTTTPLLCRV